MIIYGLLMLCLKVLTILASIFGSLIPSFPGSITSVLNTLSTMVSGGLTFLSYLFDVNVIYALLSLVIAYYGFAVIKDSVMKVIGHFIGN